MEHELWDAEDDPGDDRDDHTDQDPGGDFVTVDSQDRAQASHHARLQACRVHIAAKAATRW